MITVVATLFMPAVLAMSALRLYQLPRDLRRGTRRLHPRRPLAAGLAAAGVYLALGAHTLFVLWTAARLMAQPPQNVTELLGALPAIVAYPFVYLLCEWVSFYAIRPASAG